MESTNSGDGRESTAVNGPQQSAAPPERMLPVCPHCGTDPARVLAVLVRLDERSDLAAIVYYCGQSGCRAIFSVAPVPMDPALIAQSIMAWQPPQPPAGKIWKP